MIVRSLGRWAGVVPVAFSLVLAACMLPDRRTGPGESSSSAEPQAPQRTKSVAIGVIAQVTAMGNMGGQSGGVGGWASVNEVHTNGLVTTEFSRPNFQRPACRARARPGSISLSSDGA